MPNLRMCGATFLSARLFISAQRYLPPKYTSDILFFLLTMNMKFPYILLGLLRTLIATSPVLPACLKLTILLHLLRHTKVSWTHPWLFDSLAQGN